MALKDILKLENYEPSGVSCIGDLVSKEIRKRYSIPDLFWDEELTKSAVGFCFQSFYFLEYFLKDTNNNPKDVRDYIGKEIKQASMDEIEEVITIFTDKVKDFLPLHYYSKAVSVYHNVLKQAEEFKKAMNILSTVVQPMLETNNGIISFTYLKKILGPEMFLDLYTNLPSDLRFRDKNITSADIEGIRDAFNEFDKNRNKLHKDILNFGERHFNKDYLDVFLDVMSNDYFKVKGILNFYVPDKKHGYLVLNVGVISIPSGGSEFALDYGQAFDFSGMLIKSCYESLKRAREFSNEFYKSVEYKSQISENRSEQQDNALLEKVKQKYPEYVSFIGDLISDSMHGKMIFGKILEINVNRIRKKERYPENKLEEMKNYISSLLPEYKGHRS